MLGKEAISESEPFEPKITIIDDFSALIKIYDANPVEREKIIRDHYENSDRFGFGGISLEEYIQSIQAHFSENSLQYLEDEKKFLDKINSEDLKNLLNKPIEKVGSFFRVTLDNPKIILLLNGIKTDGKMIENDTFGINLQSLFRTYYSEETRVLDYEIIVEEIGSISAHEFTHCFCRKMEWDREGKDRLLEILFEEGLATTMQDSHYPWHDEYLAEYDFWINIIKESVNANGSEKYLKILKEISKNDTRNFYYPKAVELINETVLENRVITDKEFNFLITQSLVKKNGPIYHVGFKLWSNIYEKEGLEGVKKRILLGPKSFEEFFV